MSQDQKRGPGARKVELERRLDANAELKRASANDDRHDRRLDDGRRDADGAEFATPAQQATGRGHKAQQAQPHRSGRPSGGNIRDERR